MHYIMAINKIGTTERGLEQGSQTYLHWRHKRGTDDNITSVRDEAPMYKLFKM